MSKIASIRWPFRVHLGLRRSSERVGNNWRSERTGRGHFRTTKTTRKWRWWKSWCVCKWHSWRKMIYCGPTRIEKKKIFVWEESTRTNYICKNINAQSIPAATSDTQNRHLRPLKSFSGLFATVKRRRGQSLFYVDGVVENFPMCMCTCSWTLETYQYSY